MGGGRNCEGSGGETADRNHSRTALPDFLTKRYDIVLTCEFQLGTIEPFGSEIPIAGAGLVEVETGFQQAGLVRP